MKIDPERSIASDVAAEALPRAPVSRDEKAAALVQSRLLAICTRHRDELLNDWIENILALPPEHTRIADRPIAEFIEYMNACLDAFTEMLVSGSEHLLETFVGDLVDQRFSAGGPLLAASQFRKTIAGVLDTTLADPNGAPAPPAVDVLLAADELLLQFERRFAEAHKQRSLLESEARYREIFEIASDILATIDRRGILIQINARLEALLGHEPAAWIGRPIADLAVTADAERITDAITAAERGAPGDEVTVRCATRDGARRRMSIRVSSLSGGDKLLVVLRDVTEEVARRAQLLHGEKLATIDQVAASVAHELNNPMAWVMANLEQIQAATIRLARAVRLARTEGAWHELPPVIDAIDRSSSEALVGVERMRDIVTDLNVFSSRGERRPERMDLGDVIELAQRMTGPQLSQLCRFERCFDEMPPLVGYAGKLSQVFVNLFINAAQAMPQDRPADKNRVQVTARYDAGTYHIEVEDNGLGMVPEVAERIFDPLFTTKEESDGAGIGLWISRTILEEHHGTMSVSSTPGEGTRFTIRLVGLDPAALPAARAAPATPPPPARATILIVDDEPMLLRVFARSLDDHHEILVAESGRQALDVLEARGGNVDAIVCDLLMPQMSGMDLYDAVGERYPELQRRMAFMSGGAFTKRAIEFVEHVPNPQIAKPIAVGDLERAIADLLRAG